MKILYIANIRLPTEKAHGIQIMKMCEAFARTGHTVELVVPTRKTPITDDPFTYYGVEKIFKITTLSVPDFVRFGRAGFLFSALYFSERVRWIKQFWNADVIYSRDAFVLAQYILLGRHVVFEAHTKPSNMACFVARNAHRVVVISKALYKEYISMGVAPAKIIIAHDAVDLHQFEIDKSKTELRQQFGLAKERNIIGYIGKYKTMGKPKGVGDLSIALPLVLASFPTAFLLLVGINKEEVKEVKEMLYRANVAEENYKIVTHIHQHEAFLYMKVSDVLVMTYPNTPHYALYMSPMKLFEYMASGTPIVTSDLQTIREILDDKDATFFTPDDTVALATAIGTVFSDGKTAQEKVQNALQKVKEYTWDKRAEHIVNTFKKDI